MRGGRLERLTRDHTVTQTLVDEGRLSAEEARVDDRRVLLNRALSADSSASSRPDLAVRACEPGDRYVLTTDGVHSALDPADLGALLVAEVSPEEAVERVARAVRAAGEPDNWAVVIGDLAT